MAEWSSIDFPPAFANLASVMTDQTTKSYEIAFLLRNEEGAAVLMRHLRQFGAEILAEGEIKERKLSYPIDHLKSAYFGYIHFKASPAVIGDLTEAMNLDKEILRFLIITPPFLPKEKNQRPPAQSEKSRTAKPRAEAKPVGPLVESQLSNDLLEQKLEEILGE